MSSQALTDKYRPKAFDQVIGQESAAKIIKAVVKNPKKSPKSMIFHGSWGTGKTTLARVFGRALSCEAYERTGKICFTCPTCKSFENLNERYVEYDSSLVGNVQAIQEMRNFFDQVTPYYRVIVFDEVHLASSKAQSALLKIIEEGSPTTFYVFCTTEYDKILKTIQSRSLPVEFFQIQSTLMVDYMAEICSLEGVTDVSAEVLQKVALKSDGHMRDALMTLSGYILSRDESLISLPIDEIKEFLFYVSQKNWEMSRKKIDIIMKNPIFQINRSLHYVIMKLIEAYTVQEENGYLDIAKRLGKGNLQLFKFVAEPWVQESMKDSYLTYSLFLTIIKMFGGY